MLNVTGLDSAKSHNITVVEVSDCKLQPAVLWEILNFLRFDPKKPTSAPNVHEAKNLRRS